MRPEPQFGELADIGIIQRALAQDLERLCSIAPRIGDQIVSYFQAINIGLMVVSIACVFSWLLFLRPDGEAVRLNIPHLGQEQEERLLFHLDSLNTTLLKVSQK